MWKKIWLRQEVLVWQQTVLVRDSWVGNELRVCDKARLWKNMSSWKKHVSCFRVMRNWRRMSNALFMHWFIVVKRKVVRNITRVTMKWR